MIYRIALHCECAVSVFAFDSIQSAAHLSDRIETIEMCVFFPFFVPFQRKYDHRTERSSFDIIVYPNAYIYLIRIETIRTHTQTHTPKRIIIGIYLFIHHFLDCVFFLSLFSLSLSFLSIFSLSRSFARSETSSLLSLFGLHISMHKTHPNVR